MLTNGTQGAEPFWEVMKKTKTTLFTSEESKPPGPRGPARPAGSKTHPFPFWDGAKGTAFEFIM